MSQLTDAADALKRHIKTLEAFQYAAAALEGLDSMANEQREAQGRLDAINQQAADARSRLDGMKVQADNKAAELKQAEVQNQHAAEAAIAAAEKESAGIIEAANVQAKSIIEAASKTASDLKALAAQKAVHFRNEANDAETALDRAKTELAAVHAQNAAAKKMLAEITDKIIAAQAKIASMLSP